MAIIMGHEFYRDNTKTPLNDCTKEQRPAPNDPHWACKG